jgi:hypothetical protein
MKTRIALFILSVAAMAVFGLFTQAKAEMVDQRPYWSMMCFPDESAPYQVEAINGKTLVITSIHGVHHRYGVVDYARVSPGFIIMATDGNRLITAAFGPDHGMLKTTKGTDVCSSDLGNES